jgi:hypothetical protein
MAREHLVTLNVVERPDASTPPAAVGGRGLARPGTLAERTKLPVPQRGELIQGTGATQVRHVLTDPERAAAERVAWRRRPAMMRFAFDKWDRLEPVPVLHEGRHANPLPGGVLCARLFGVHTVGLSSTASTSHRRHLGRHVCSERPWRDSRLCRRRFCLESSRARPCRLRFEPAALRLPPPFGSSNEDDPVSVLRCRGQDLAAVSSAAIGDLRCRQRRMEAVPKVREASSSLKLTAGAR